jgi:hypothetical protein
MYCRRRRRWLDETHGLITDVAGGGGDGLMKRINKYSAVQFIWRTVRITKLTREGHIILGAFNFVNKDATENDRERII